MTIKWPAAAALIPSFAPSVQTMISTTSSATASSLPRRTPGANDRAVLAAYGLVPDTPEPEIVAHLFKLYAEKIQERK